MSAASEIDEPTPAAAPRTAETMGTALSRIAIISGLKCFSSAPPASAFGSPGCTVPPERLAPEQNARSPEASRIAREEPAAASIASFSSVARSEVMAFIVLGSLRRITATSPSFSTSSLSDMEISGRSGRAGREGPRRASQRYSGVSQNGK